MEALRFDSVMKAHGHLSRQSLEVPTLNETPAVASYLFIKVIFF